MVKKVRLPVYTELVISEQNTAIKAPDGSIQFVSYPKTIKVENKEYFDVKDQYLSFINNYRESINEDFIGGMPVTLEKNCMKQLLRINPVTNSLVYGMTLKVDGERFLMFNSKEGFIYFIDRSLNMFYFENTNGTRHRLNPDIVKPFLFDGELVTYKSGEFEFLIFDTLFYQNSSIVQSWMEYHYDQRFIILQQAVDTVLSPFYSSTFTDNQFFCSYKKWFPITTILETNDIYKYIDNITNETRLKKFSLISDGIILQPFDKPYIPFKPWNMYDNVQFKWKPSEDQTVDFKIKIINNSNWHLLTKTDQVFNVSQKVGKPVPATCIPTSKNIREFKDGDVAEFVLQTKFNPQKNLFTLVRARTEKGANSYDTVMSALEAAVNPFKLDILKPALELITKGIKGNDIKKYMNNFSKSQLILCILKESLFFTDKEKNEIREVYLKYLNIKSVQRVKIDERDLEVEITEGNLRPTTLHSRYIPQKIELKGTNELELRLFKRGKKGNILDKFTFFYLYDFLKQNFPVTRTKLIDVSLNLPDESGKYRSTYANIEDIQNGTPIENIYKKKIDNFIFFPTDKGQKLYNNIVFKLEYSKELISNKIIRLTSDINNRIINNNIRFKDRHSYNINKYWRLDLTKVISTYNINEIKNETYEIECEYVGDYSVSFDKFISSLSNLYMFLLNNSSYC